MQLKYKYLGENQEMCRNYTKTQTQNFIEDDKTRPE